MRLAGFAVHWRMMRFGSGLDVTAELPFMLPVVVDREKNGTNVRKPPISVGAHVSSAREIYERGRRKPADHAGLRKGGAEPAAESHPGR